MSRRVGRHRWWVASACVAAAATVLSTSPLALGPPADRVLASRTYRSEDGLPNGIIYALAQDRDGYLWIGGSGGLVRFDGIQFVPWGANGETPLPFGEVRSLLADRDGSLWIGFNEGGVVSRISNRQVYTYTVADGLPSGIVHPRAQDREGAIWAVGPGGIVAFLNRTWEIRQGRDGLPTSSSERAFTDRSGAFWISTALGIFRRGPTATQFERVSDGQATAFGEGAHGELWAIHPGLGLRRFSKALGFTAIGAATDINGGTMVIDRRGDHWIGSPYRAGLLHVSVDPVTSALSVHPLSDERGVFDKLVLALFEDRDDNMWAGTSGGLLRFYEPKAEVYSRARGLPDDNVRAIETSPQGGLWLGTARGLAQVNAAGLVEQTHIPGIRGRSITSLHADPAGRLWIGFADSGLGVLANGQFTPINTPGLSIHENVMTVRPDDQGGLAVCNLLDFGAYYRRGQGPFTKIPGLFPPGRGGCSATLRDRDGRLWFGFDDGSLLVQEPNTERRVLRGEGSPRGRVCAIHEDSERTIWIATTEGLSRYRDGRFATISARNGLPSNYFTALIEDGKGDLWVCANSGIVRLTKAEFDRAAADASYRVRYTLYDSSDGINDTPVCYGEPHAARDRDGRLWFSSLSGAVVVDPVRLEQRQLELAPRLERVVADNVTLERGTSSLPARTARLEFQYTAVNLSAASKVRFQYQLEGFDTSWVDAGNRRQAFYTNLSPGRYRFRVRASMDEAPGPATSFDFDVQPAFYQRSAFYGALGVAAALLLWAAWQVRVRALHHEYALIMNERTRIGREIHDTVLQNMAGVALEIEGVARQSQSPGPLLRDALARISNDIKEHIAEARHTIWELRTPEEGTVTLERTLREAAERIVGGTEIRFDLDVVGTPRSYGRDVERELIRIAREALRNAVRHSGATAIRLELTYTPDALRLRISDNGRGFDVQAHLAAETDHWGLLGMQERASRIGAQFNLHSDASSGTAVDMVVRHART